MDFGKLIKFVIIWHLHNKENWKIKERKRETRKEEKDLNSWKSAGSTARENNTWNSQ